MLRTGPRTQASGGAPERCGLSGSLAFDKIQDLDVQYYTPSSRSDKDIRCVTNLHRRMRAIVALSVLWGVLVASDIAADVAAVDAFLADNPKSLAVLRQSLASLQIYRSSSTRTSQSKATQKRQLLSSSSATPVFCQRSMRDSEVAAKRKDTRQRGSGPVFLWSVKGRLQTGMLCSPTDFESA
jgi:hypothetical protein